MRDDGEGERRPGERESESQSLKEQARSTHEEARMVLPGIQALFGFQLIAVFNPPFFDLAPAHRLLHLLSLVLVAIAIGLIMAPAAYHRLAEATRVSRRWVRMAARDIAGAMASLMLAVALDVYLVAAIITRDKRDRRSRRGGDGRFPLLALVHPAPRAPAPGESNGMSFIWAI